MKRLDYVGLNPSFFYCLLTFLLHYTCIIKKKCLNHRSIFPLLYNHHFNLSFYWSRRHCTANYERSSLTRGNFLHITWNVAHFISLCHSFPISKTARIVHVSLLMDSCKVWFKFLEGMQGILWLHTLLTSLNWINNINIPLRKIGFLGKS